MRPSPHAFAAFVLLAAAHAACSGPDPGFVEFGGDAPPGGGGGGTSGTTSGGSNGGTSGGTGDGGGGTSSGDGGGGDGGASSGNFNPINLWQGLPAFGSAGAQVSPGNSTNSNHGGNGNPAGQACLDCHVTGGNAAGDQWAIAGTVYLDAAGNTPAGGAEVRVTTNEGVQLALVKADANGNFWVPKGNITIPPMSISAARTAAAAKTMASRLSGNADGSCNKTACHAADRINP